MPISLSSTHAPRRTGDVRSPYDVRSKYCALAEKAPAFFFAYRHPAELRAEDAGNPIVARQALIQERVVGGQQIPDTAIFQENAAQEIFRLFREIAPQLDR